MKRALGDWARTSCTHGGRWSQANPWETWKATLKVTKAVKQIKNHFPDERGPLTLIPSDENENLTSKCVAPLKRGPDYRLSEE